MLPTPCPGWSVLGLTSHLLGVDLSLLAGQRDDHHGTPAPSGMSEDAFIAWLDDLQVEWVLAARRLSPRLVVDLLDWTDAQVVEMLESQDETAVSATVSWASTGQVPVWLDQARELSERWIHRQQILQTIGNPSDLRPDLVVPVLDGLRWAYPFRLLPHQRPAGATVEISVSAPTIGFRWYLVSDGIGWHFQPRPGDRLVAQLTMTVEQTWRLLTNNLESHNHGEVLGSGDPDIVASLLRTRAIIGAPKEASG
jgi:Mycothiol maleylpyruvate isomerase N-terminal domain